MGRGAEQDHLEVVVTNVGSRPARIWQTWNSWGSKTLSLEVRAQGTSTICTIQNGLCTWTMNGPTTKQIPVGASATEMISPYDGYTWIVPRECFGFDGPVEYRARLQIGNDFEETRKLGVTECDVYSPWYLSNSPRRWLPDRPTWDRFEGSLIPPKNK